MSQSEAQERPDNDDEEGKGVDGDDEDGVDGDDLLQPGVDGSQLVLDAELQTRVSQAVHREEETVQLGHDVTYIDMN